MRPGHLFIILFFVFYISSFLGVYYIVGHFKPGDKSTSNTPRLSTPSTLIQLPPTADFTPASPDAAQCDARESVGGEGDIDVHYIMNKYRVLAAELKREVLRKKGDAASSVPETKVKCESQLRIATYNLWNINGPWIKRREKILEYFQDLKLDIIGLQEIRFFENINQMESLKKSLPEFEYSYYEKVQNENVGKEEGIGILSRFPIIETRSTQFGTANRKCVTALIDVPDVGKVSFSVTHLGLNDYDQCSQTVSLWKFVNEHFAEHPKIVVGDMNTYFDFEWPVDFLTQGFTPFMLSKYNPCMKVVEEFHKEYEGNKALKEASVFTDVWEELYPPVPSTTDDRWWSVWANPPGHTFSNFGGQDGSRTDRIYHSNPRNHSGLDLCGVELFGDDVIEMKNNEVMYPSDHKGVLATFRRREAK